MPVTAAPRPPAPISLLLLLRAATIKAARVVVAALAGLPLPMHLSVMHETVLLWLLLLLVLLLLFQ
jgi:hypothetical protein